MYTKYLPGYLPLEALILLRFILRPAIFKIHVYLNNHKNRIKKKMPRIQSLKFHNSFSNFIRYPSQKSTWFLGEASQVCVFRDVIWNFYSHMVHCYWKWKKIARHPNNSLNIFVDTPLPHARSIVNFWGVNMLDLMCKFRGDVIWNFPSHIVLKKFRRIKKFKVWEQMVWRYGRQVPKFHKIWH